MNLRKTQPTRPRKHKYVPILALVAALSCTMTGCTTTTTHTQPPKQQSTPSATLTPAASYCEAARNIVAAAKQPGPAKTTAGTIQAGLRKMVTLTGDLTRTASQEQGSRSWRATHGAYSKALTFYVAHDKQVADDDFLYLLGKAAESQNAAVHKATTATKADCSVDLQPLMVRK